MLVVASNLRSLEPSVPTTLSLLKRDSDMGRNSNILEFFFKEGKLFKWII